MGFFDWLLHGTKRQRSVEPSCGRADQHDGQNHVPRIDWINPIARKQTRQRGSGGKRKIKINPIELTRKIKIKQNWSQNAISINLINKGYRCKEPHCCSALSSWKIVENNHFGMLHFFASQWWRWMPLTVATELVYSTARCASNVMAQNHSSSCSWSSTCW